jgi:LacI family transcriptional regulator
MFISQSSFAHRRQRLLELLSALSYADNEIRVTCLQTVSGGGMLSSKRRRVALIVEMSSQYGRQVLRGVGKYMRSHHPWSIFLEQRDLRWEPPPWLLKHKWDGIISRPTDPRFAAAVARRGIPMVDLNDLYANLGFPHIWSDHCAIGRLGAKHFLERGFRSFAFCSFANELWAEQRRDGFVQIVREAGYDCAVYESPWRGVDTLEWDKDQELMAEWIETCPRPLGVMACNDVRGQHVIDACYRNQIVIPEGAAVVGVDDEQVLCTMSDPPLSSVSPNPERIGYEAAELLDQLMAGEPSVAEERLIEPIGVVIRQSSDVLGIDDDNVASALGYIRQNACHGITVDDVLRHVHVSRSFLERRFRHYLGRSPHAEIRQVQLKRIKQLLSDTELSLETIAKLTGFAHPEYMSVVFKRLTGSRPGQYRAQASKR